MAEDPGSQRSEGRVALVVGTTGGLRPQLAVRGASVVVVGPDAGSVGRAVADLRTGGTRAAGFVGDPADDTVVRAAVELARELFGQVDVVGDDGAERFADFVEAVVGLVGRPVEVLRDSDRSDGRPG